MSFATQDFRLATKGFVANALILVASLAWNEALIQTIRVWFPNRRDDVIGLLLHALLVTFIVYVAFRVLDRMLPNSEKK